MLQKVNSLMLVTSIIPNLDGFVYHVSTKYYIGRCLAIHNSNLSIFQSLKTGGRVWKIFLNKTCGVSLNTTVLPLKQEQWSIDQIIPFVYLFDYKHITELIKVLCTCIEKNNFWALFHDNCAKYGWNWQSGSWENKKKIP